MSDFETDPVLIGDVLREHDVFMPDGTVNKLGVIGLFTGRNADEVDPLEVLPNESLAEMAIDPSVELDVVERIQAISNRRAQELQATAETDAESDLSQMSDEALMALLRNKNTPHETISEIARIAQDRQAKRTLSTDD